jgi:uncharacterized membrane protein YoaK (UPF0700 family)
MKKAIVVALLSFNAGFLDTAGFLGLQGLFTAHVTGNFVTLGAALVFGTHGVIGKVLALPEFIIVLVLARLAGTMLTARQKPTLRILLFAKVLFLIAFFVLGVVLGPFSDSDAPDWLPDLRASLPWRYRMGSSAFTLAIFRPRRS